MTQNNLENINMPILQYDCFGRCTWHNELAQIMLIDPMDELLGLPASTVEPFSIHVARYFRTLHNVLKTASSSQLELVFDPYRDGEKKSFLIRFLPELNENGALIGVLAVAQETGIQDSVAPTALRN